MFWWVLYLLLLVGAGSHLLVPSYESFIPLLLLIFINAYFSFRWIWQPRGKLWKLLFLSLLQLALFSFTFRLLYILGGETYYTFLHPPQAWDWCQLTLVHVLRAADFMDAIEGYGWHLQNIKSQGYLSGSAIVSLHLLVDFFLFTTLYKILQQTQFSTMLWKKLLQTTKVFSLMGLSALGIYLLYNIRVFYPFLVWGIVCGFMGLTMSFWTFETPRKKKVREILPPIIFPLLTIFGGFFLYPFWLEHSLSIQIILFLGFLWLAGLATIALSYITQRLLFTLWSIPLTYAFFPLFLFILSFGGFCQWIWIYHLGWIEGSKDFFIFFFTLDNLFRAIDVLDMSQVYGWNWSQGNYQGWLFSTVVVSFRFLASTFFYQSVYKFFLFMGFSRIVSLEKKLEMLKDADPVIRKSAENQLKKYPDKEIIPYILSFLQGSEERKLLALEICHNHAENRLIPYVIPLLNERFEGVLKILKKCDLDEVCSYLIPLLTNKEDQNRECASEALIELEAKKKIGEIAPLLEHKDGEIRELGISTLWRLGDQTELKNATHLLKDPYSKVRRSYVEVLANLGISPGASQLMEMLKDEKEGVRSAVIRSISQLKTEEAIPDLICLLKKEKDYEVREEILRALVSLEAKESVSDILPFLKFLDKKKVRGQFGDYEDWSFEEQEEIDLGRLAVWALGELGDSQLIPKLIPYQEIPDEEVVDEIRDALDKLESPRKQK